MTARLTIEELASTVGMTVRNVREHQTRGLLDPPTVEGRKGYYGERHVARLRLIRELQDEGLNLQAIAWLLEQAPPGASGEIARLRTALFAPWTTEEPRTYTRDELVVMFAPEGTPEALARAEALGLLRPLDGDRFEAPAPRLLDAGAQLVEVGIAPAAALDIVEALFAQADVVARTFLDLFLTHVWGPFEEAGRPADRLGEVTAALERLRPIASEAVTAAFQQRMGLLIDREVHERASDT